MPARYSAAMIDRRHFIALAAIPVAGLGAHSSQATGMSRVTAYAFMFKGLDGDHILLSSYAGHPLLVVPFDHRERGAFEVRGEALFGQSQLSGGFGVVTDRGRERKGRIGHA